MNLKTMTVAELKTHLLNELNGLNDDDVITFGGGQLSLYRLKNRGPTTGRKLLDIEFNEVYSVTVDPDKL